MKRIISTMLALFMVFAFVACASKGDNANTTQEANTTEAVNATQQNDTTQPVSSNETQVAEQEAGDGEEAADVTITIPASYLEYMEDTTFDDDEMKEYGFRDVVENNDGSISFTMSKIKHKELLSELEAMVEQLFEQTTGFEGSYVKSATATDKYETITLEVDKEVYEQSVSMSPASIDPFVVGLAATSYQAYAGLNPYCEVIIKDADSDEIIKSVIYPDALDKLKDQSVPSFF